MKPLTHCPYCQSVLIKKTIPEHLNSMKYENCSARCVVDYFQHFKSLYDEPELDHITYNTPNNRFYIYTYFNNAFHKHISLVYSTEKTEKYGISMPILQLPLNKYPLDVTNLQAVQDKISTLSLFV